VHFVVQGADAAGGSTVIGGPRHGSERIRANDDAELELGRK